MVYIEKMGNYIEKPIEVRASGVDHKGLYIIDLVKSDNSPAQGNDVIRKQQTDLSNDMVLNGGEGNSTPVTNIFR